MSGPGLTTARINAALDSAATGLAYVSLHTASPGATGANDVTGGSPAYARKAATPGSAASSSKDLIGGTLSFDVPACTVTHCGYWTALTGGTFLGGEQLSASETFAAQGTYNLTAATLTGSST